MQPARLSTSGTHYHTRRRRQTAGSVVLSTLLVGNAAARPLDGSLSNAVVDLLIGGPFGTQHEDVTERRRFATNARNAAAAARVYRTTGGIAAYENTRFALPQRLQASARRSPHARQTFLEALFRWGHDGRS